MNSPLTEPDRAALRVLVCEDDPLMQEGIQTMLGPVDDIEVAGQAFDGEEAVDYARRLNPDLVVVDLKMPKISGLEALAQIKAFAPETPVLVFTAYLKEGDVQRAIDAGAAGYLLKGMPKDEFVTALRDAVGGRHSASPEVAPILFELAQSPDLGLDELDLMILRLTAEALSTREVASAVGKSVNTVRSRLHDVARTMGLETHRYQHAASLAIQRGMIRVREPRS